jgi:hypothetical protein
MTEPFVRGQKSLLQDIVRPQASAQRFRQPEMDDAPQSFLLAGKQLRQRLGITFSQALLKVLGLNTGIAGHAWAP